MIVNQSGMYPQAQPIMDRRVSPVYQPIEERPGTPMSNYIWIAIFAISIPAGIIAVAMKLTRTQTTTTMTSTYAAYPTAPTYDTVSTDACDLGPCKREFYMYRAQSDHNYPMENVNTASLAGVMWYLHNEIVQSIPRKYEVTRVMRLKVTMMNTQAWYDAHQTQFGPYVAFDLGHCTVPNCQHIWDTYGYVVGCQAPNTAVANYRAARKTVKHCQQGECHVPVWYSLPGVCPTRTYDDKTPECIALEPGGFAFASYNETTGLGSKDDWQVTGGYNATFHVDWAGEVTLDELVGIANYTDFTAMGYQEYSKLEDRGYGTTFWDGIHNSTACTERMERLKYLLNERIAQYGSNEKFPADLPEPLCDVA